VAQMLELPVLAGFRLRHQLESNAWQDMQHLSLEVPGRTTAIESAQTRENPLLARGLSGAEGI
jgi:hypothetical protein